jgi:hypothetical protein
LYFPSCEKSFIVDEYQRKAQKRGNSLMFKEPILSSQ